MCSVIQQLHVVKNEELDFQRQLSKKLGYPLQCSLTLFHTDETIRRPHTSTTIK